MKERILGEPKQKHIKHRKEKLKMNKWIYTYICQCSPHLNPVIHHSPLQEEQADTNGLLI